jgi:hypothetical protein
VAAEYQVDAVVQGGRTVFASVSRYFVPVLAHTAGEVVGSRILAPGTLEHRELGALHDRAVRALGLRDGVTHLEVLRSRGRLFVGEIARRPGGGGIADCVAAATGVDLWEHFLRAELNDPARPVPAAAPVPLARCDLPVRAGEVTAVTPVEDLFAVEGVVSATVSVRPGDNVPPPRSSAANAGHVVFRLAEDGSHAGPLARVLESFDLRTATPDPQGAHA